MQLPIRGTQSVTPLAVPLFIFTGIPAEKYVGILLYQTEGLLTLW
jgi:hypothetical protein